MAQQTGGDQMAPGVYGLILAASVGLAGCSGGKAMVSADKEIGVFRQQVAEGRYDEIWQGADADLRGGGQAPFTKFLSVVHDRLGAVKTSQQTGWNVNYTTAGTRISVAMHTVFAKGSGDEQFLFKQQGETLKLAGYHINSMELITN